MYKGEDQNSRALLFPMYGVTTNPLEPPMLAFLANINNNSLALQGNMCTIDEAFANDWVPLENTGRFSHGDACVCDERQRP